MTPSTASASPESPQVSSSSSGGKCPVDHKSRSLWSVLGVKRAKEENEMVNPSTSVRDEEELKAKNTPASLEEAAKYAQIPHPSQRLPLSTHRAESTIPRGAAGGGGSQAEQQQETLPKIPHHQLGVNPTDKWVYPSEQQVFNAMKRKGWEGIEEESIPSFLQIHNSVNERSWKLLQEWEKDNNNNNLRLVRFEGRPKDLTPKAWIWSNLFFQNPPFDRHDWYVDNGIQKEKRYVLDFYMMNDNASSSSLPRVEIDVRPALDTPSAVFERGQRILMDLFPGITKEFQRMKTSNNSQTSER